MNSPPGMARASRGGQPGFGTGVITKLELWRKESERLRAGKRQMKEDKKVERNGER